MRGSPIGQRAAAHREPHVSPMDAAPWISGRSFVATHRNLVMARWGGVPGAAQLDALRIATRSVARAYPGGGALLDVIDVARGSSRLDPDLASGLERLRGEEHAENLGVAHVVLPRGLAGVAIRSTLGALSLVARSQSPSGVFSDVAPAAAWLTERLGHAAPGADRSERWTTREILTAWDRIAESGEAAQHAA